MMQEELWVVVHSLARTTLFHKYAFLNFIVSVNCPCPCLFTFLLTTDDTFNF